MLSNKLKYENKRNDFNIELLILKVKEYLKYTLHCIVLPHCILDIPYINKGKMSNPKPIKKKVT